ncbi:MAG: transcription elongation factor GreAB [Verrucomicrobiota bacterium]
MNKAEIVAKIRDQLREQYDRMAGAAQTAHDYATDQDAKAESKYDTRSLEASYLAAGQAEKAEELAEALEVFADLQLPEFEDTDAIDVGAFIEADVEGELSYYLIAPRGGGVVCEHEGCDLTVLTPDSPLAKQLLGMRAGDNLDAPALTVFEVC